MLLLAHRRDAGPRAAVGAEPAQDAYGLGPAHSVGRRAAVGLEVHERPGGARSEDPVDPTAVEPEPVEERLELGDVVAAQVRRREQEVAIAELPCRLDERAPG